MGIRHGVLAAVLEKIPLVRMADVTGNGESELHIGPRAGGAIGTVLRHIGSKSIGVGPLTVVVGVA